MIVWEKKEMTIEEFREKAKDEEYAPGWDAIEEREQTLSCLVRES